MLKLLRLNNWVKNLFILFPVFFAGKILSLQYLEIKNLVITFISFCFSSSLIYIINDLKDVEKDRLHPKKSKRPIASGKVSVIQAIVLMCILSGLIVATFAFMPIQIIYFVVAYIVMNIFYCFGLKNFAIVDVTSISLGFVFRIMAGGIAANTLTTHWIIILIFLLMFSIALAKRRDDLILSETNKEVYRKSQYGYNIPFIDTAKTISFTVTLVAYITYSVSNDVMERLGSQYVYITSLPVFLGIIRYIQLAIVHKKTGSPVDLLLKDRFLIACILLWLLIFIAIIYV
jgi:decaprenyl-phosphate phosphoribosyltransferase